MSTALPEPPIRRLTRDDLRHCADLAQNRGWARAEGTWGLLLAAGTGFGIDAPEGEGLAACCVLMPYDSGLAAVGKLLVAGEYARRGLGRRVMAQIMAAAGETPLVLYATPQGRPIYQELGFVETGRTERLRGTLDGTADASVTGVLTRRATAEDIPAIVRLDAAVFGVDRTHLITRLPATADRLWVAEEGGEIIGCAAGWTSSDAYGIGPLTARDTATAKALLVTIARSVEGPVLLSVHGEQKGLLDWAVEHGLTPVSGTSEMVYGIGELPGDRRRAFAPLSLATG
ncbi:GNAT family N-acetyltransferase [Streptomyces sp. NPDC020875]|uniref:GNAT family N-acetyltransferase n=1 Tax=Streptomyces sp. NPDC020875 TaxID=3154898 RepID=UPI0033F7AD56